MDLLEEIFFFSHSHIFSYFWSMDIFYHILLWMILPAENVNL